MTAKRVKIIVTPSVNAVKLLQYIDKHIAEIRASGFYIKVEKISRKDMDAEMTEILRKNNIPRLPAMRMPGGKCFIGNNNIIGELSKRTRHVQSSRVVEMMPGNVESFLDREMYTYDETGKRIPRKDDEDGDSDKRDIEKRLSSFTPPKHYTEPANRLNEINRANYDANNTQHDNITMPDILQNPLPTHGDADDDMMSKWMQNNMGGDY